MKTLFLLRHAKSDWANPDTRDFDRPLNARGRKAARAMGGELRRLGLAADHIIASPAARVAETLTLLADGFGGRMPVQENERLYLASADTLFGIIRAADDRCPSLLLAGHNPGLHQVTLGLVEASPERTEVAAKYPTGALAEIVFAIERWAEIASGSGRLARFIKPRDLAADFALDED
jgi:phosphohistidine phosphatase